MLSTDKQTNKQTDRQTDRQTNQRYQKHNLLCQGGNKKKLSGLFMFVDFEKDFDSIEWAFLFRTLAKFNLGCDFQQWVKLLYTSPYASVKNNGYSSSEFCLSRGVRQGCQVSALIFILCMEVMANHIRQNVNIRGLSLDEHGVNNIKTRKLHLQANVTKKVIILHNPSYRL